MDDAHSHKTTKVFKSGNSKAVRLPAAFAIKPGAEVRVREEQGRYIIEPVDMAEKLVDLKGIAGAIRSEPRGGGDRAMAPRALDWDRKLPGVD